MSPLALSALARKTKLACVLPVVVTNAMSLRSGLGVPLGPLTCTVHSLLKSSVARPSVPSMASCALPNSRIFWLAPG